MRVPSRRTRHRASVLAAGRAAILPEWHLAPQQSLQDSSTTFVALVSRVACNNGVTGEVLAPDVRMTGTEVIVTFTVAAKPNEPAPCQGNDEVPYQVDLGEPLGGRALVDGVCRIGDRILAKAVFCASGATRFTP